MKKKLPKSCDKLPTKKQVPESIRREDYWKDPDYWVFVEQKALENIPHKGTDAGGDNR